MQESRSDGWNNFLERVTSFCNKHSAEIPAMDGCYVPYGKSARKARAQKQTNDDHFRREVYIGVLDQISQELDNRFDKINMELLSYMLAFSPSNSFASFDAQKLHRLMSSTQRSSQIIICSNLNCSYKIKLMTLDRMIASKV
jgi:hypothetical protein